MSKYIYGKPQTKRVAGIGEYESEWIELRNVKWADAQLVNAMAKDDQLNLIVPFIVDWSVADENGKKAPISAATLAELPIEIVLPAVNHFNDLFLSLGKLAQPKNGN